jgi:hypothetical protein
MFTCDSVPYYCAQTLPKRMSTDRATVKTFAAIFQKGSVVTASNNYWSSTTYAPDTSNAWNVNFNNGNGNANNKTNSNYVRCVRGGEYEQ